MRLLLILVLTGLMDAARSFLPEPRLGSGAAGIALACGYLLLTAFLLGSIFKSVGLPRLTGYLATGILVGPSVLNLVSQPMVENLRIFNGVATALIALTAGVELDLKATRPLFKSISWITGLAIIGTMALLCLAVHLARPILPFLHVLTPTQAWAICAVFGVTLAAQSPAVVVALHSEMESDGPLTRTVLGVVVMSDLVVIILFAVVSSIAKAFFGPGSDAWKTAGALAWEVPGSIAIGVIVGVLISVYLRYVKGSAELFVLAAAFLVAEIGQRVDLDPLLIALAAGMLIRNATSHGARLQEEIEASSLPVYVVFFAVTGAGIHVKELAVLGIPAALLVATRAAGFMGGGWLAATIVDAPKNVRKFIGWGLMPQAGLALALALLFTKTFPQLGGEASALILGVVALNEMLAPVLYRFGLARSGEGGKAVRAGQVGEARAAAH